MRLQLIVLALVTSRVYQRGLIESIILFYFILHMPTLFLELCFGMTVFRCLRNYLRLFS